MPADIRSFFGGPKASQGSQGSASTPAKKVEKPPQKKKARNAKVIEDSEDEDEVQVKVHTKSTPKIPPKKVKREATPEGEDIDTSAFFASKNKPKRSEPVKAKKAAETTPKATPKTTPAKTNGKKAVAPTANGRGSARAKTRTTYAEQQANEFEDDDLENDGDIFGVAYKKNGKDDYVEVPGSDDDDDMPIALPHRGTPKRTAKPQKKHKDDDDFVDDEDVDMEDVDANDDLIVPDDEEPPSKTKSRKSTATGKKRKTPELDDDEEEEQKPKRGRPKKNDTPAKSPAKKKAKKETGENADVQAIYDSITLVRPPTPPPQEEGAKFDWRANAGRGGAGPSGDGSLEMPSGSETCLAGLNFVFTGVLQHWGRPEAQELVKRHGGKITGAPSSKTSFVVAGSDAGPSKMKKIKEMNIKTIDENGLIELINKLTKSGHAGDSNAQLAFKEKQRKEEEKAQQQAAEMDREERRTQGSKPKSTGSTTANKGAESSVDSRLWTDKYAPTSLGQICGNKATVEKLQRWLQRFPKMQKTNFKLPGPDGSGSFRAVMLHGPPGIGKTTAAHLVAKIEGYDIVESNASDTRSKKLVEEGLRGVLSTTSLNGYFAGDGKKVESSKKKLVLIMDEVDGMSAGDRGGVGALAKTCKTSEIPMILICNERRQPKMKPFDFVTFDLPFRRPTVDQIRSRIMTIAFREGMKMPAPVINALIEGTHADIRQTVNMISAAKLDQEGLDFNSGKAMSKAWEKHVILKPWDITHKILGGGLFAASSKATLNDKIELYFNDHEFSPLMLQENYLGTNPIQSLQYGGKEANLKKLELASEAADSISDGDLVDRMIHGSQQQWSLMPTHAVFSFVRPASFVAGSMAGNSTRFTTWLGKNSNQQKLTRVVKEIQGHMRLRSSGDRHEIRQQYMPVLWTELVNKLQVEGKEAVPELIALMDSYFLTKDDFDAIMELGVGPMDQEKVKIDTQAKATFTRLYNQQSHPLPFMKASNVVAPKNAAKEKPDLEEAIDESDDEEVINEIKEEDEEADLSKDKYVKQPKKKAAAKKAQAPKKGKKRAADDDEEEEGEEDVKPKARGKGKGKAATGKGRAKKA
ncbi:DNA replication factor C, large subunit [Polyplosphaeria fusca]|uniref:Replication factor C subunit 1 n=1 Tax=Polyplosphaeria fusca TaxID=682080 RepID=A0A9P4RCI2_9PLEO|nr:DNA replication factor C, large subunit [Polyplosphaeria fusca]